MIVHNLKSAFRSLTRYKQQSVISIVGLAVGFVCFALTVLWVRYEDSFDKFHPDHERILGVVLQDELRQDPTLTTPYPVAEYLKEKYPEVEEACVTSFIWSPNKCLFNGDKEIEVRTLEADSNFFKVFGIQTPHRKLGELMVGNNTVVMTDKLLKSIAPTGNLTFGDPLKYKIYGMESNAFIDEVIAAWPQNTNFPFDMIVSFREDAPKHWYSYYLRTFIKVRKGIDIEAFKEKVVADQVEYFPRMTLRLIPVDEWYYTATESTRGIKHEYIRLFSIAGLLVILCSFINYLALFISRLRMRGKEIVLRRVNGANGWQLMKQLLLEFVLVLLFSVLLGFLMIEWVYPSFQELAAIQMSKASVFSELMVYVLLLVAVSVLVSLYPIVHFRRSAVQNELGGNAVRSRNIFTRFCIWLQFTVSIFFMYCTIVMVCQIYHLNTVDIGFDRQNILQIDVNTSEDNKVAEPLINELRKIPTVEHITGLKKFLFLPVRGTFSWTLTTKEGEKVSIEEKKINAEIMKMLNFRILEGEMITPRSGEILMNESAKQLMAHVDSNSYFSNVKGVVKDFLYESPLIKARPFILSYDEEETEDPIKVIMLKYREGTRYQTEKEIAAVIKDKFDNTAAWYFYMEDEYNRLLKSEQAMILLLSILSVVCVLVALFGIYSMVSLACERRRKEIAVRKVNGAGVGSLLTLFMKEYFYLLIIASAVAFVIGYKIMSTWIEGYINQINIGLWIYIVIIVFIALLVSGIISYRVWRNIHANPSEELKRE